MSAASCRGEKRLYEGMLIQRFVIVARDPRTSDIRSLRAYDGFYLGELLHLNLPSDSTRKMRILRILWLGMIPGVLGDSEAASDPNLVIW